MTPERALGESPPPDRIGDLIAAIHRTFVRVLAAFLLGAGLVVWARILGLEGPAGSGFAGEGSAEQVIIALFAVLLPLAALGLWLIQSWGPVIWLFAVALHLVALWRGWMDDANAGLLLGFHAVAISLFVCVQVARFFDARRVARAASR